MSYSRNLTMKLLAVRKLGVGRRAEHSIFESLANQ